MNKKEYEKLVVKVLEMEDLMDQDGIGIGVHPSVEDGEDGGAKKNEWEDEEEEEDTVQSLWDVY